MSDWQKRYQRLLFDRPHPRVLRVTMNRPERMNATDAIMHRELVEVWRDIDVDHSVNAVIIQGAGGKAFSYPRDWFASEADQRRVIRALHRAGKAYAVSSPETAAKQPGARNLRF